MKFFESDIAYWLSRIIIVVIACWSASAVTSVLLELVLNLFGFLSFIIVSTLISYFLFWFAFFGISLLLVENGKTQTARFILQTNFGILIAIFAGTAAIVSSGCSAMALIRTVEQKFPDYSILLWLIAIPFFCFIFYIAGKLDKAVS